jgi:hypothetical protein
MVLNTGLFETLIVFSFLVMDPMHIQSRLPCMWIGQALFHFFCCTAFWFLFDCKYGIGLCASCVEADRLNDADSSTVQPRHIIQH